MDDRAGDKTALSGTEHRRDPRRPTVKFIWYRVLSIGGEQALPDYIAEGISKSCDISISGMGMYTLHDIAVGRQVFVEVAAAEFGISAVGEVVFSRKQDDTYYRVGLRFTALPPNDRLKLSEFLGSGGEQIP